MKSRPENRLRKTKRTRVKRSRVGLVIAFVILGIAMVGMFTLPRNSSQAKPKKFKATKEIVVDKATGRVRKPTAEETDLMVAQISSLTNRSTEGLTVQPAANGGEMMDLEGRFGGVVLGRATADGGTEVRCVFTLDEATDFLGLEVAE